jgi:hypothetical protein
VIPQSLPAGGADEPMMAGDQLGKRFLVLVSEVAGKKNVIVGGNAASGSGRHLRMPKVRVWTHRRSPAHPLHRVRPTVR